MNFSITPLVLAFNEAPNIRRTLGKLKWAREIVVVDSFSTDETLAIARSFPQVRIVQRKFDNHTAQWNFGVEQCQSDWVLALDADYVLSDDLVHELQAFQPAGDADAYFARFTYCVHGRPLRGTLYPPRAVLFRRVRCRYEPEGHTQLLRITGKSAWLRGRIFHDDRKSLDRWFINQMHYSDLEARYLMETPSSKLNVADRIRKTIVLAPGLVFFFTLFGKRLILDGWPGWYYVVQRTLVEVMRSLRTLELRALQKLLIPDAIARRRMSDAGERLDPASVKFPPPTARPSGHESEPRAEELDEVELLFDQKAAYWSNKYAVNGPLRPRLYTFEKQLGEVLPPPAAVLDFGCGTGNLTGYLTGCGYAFSACDISRSMLEWARKNNPRELINWSFMPHAQRYLPYASNTFDAIIASSVFEYLINIDTVFAEFWRVLKPGGFLIATVPNKRHPIRKLEAFLYPMVILVHKLFGPKLIPRLESYALYLHCSRNRMPLDEWFAKGNQARFEAVAQDKSRASKSALVFLVFCKPTINPDKL